jgi:Acyl-CoA dehydrogenase, C-terminal domain
VYLGYTEEQEKLRQELRSYYENLLTPDVEIKLTGDPGVGPTMRRVVRQMGEDGWRLASNLPAEERVAIAKFWPADGGQRVAHAGEHIHGGVGVDRTYPLHRYFLAAKQFELNLGGATASLLRIGAIMADQAV